jgi:DNA segregation ATPase FtsK/SpoIIIE, S-DNA-T family
VVRGGSSKPAPRKGRHGRGGSSGRAKGGAARAAARARVGSSRASRGSSAASFRAFGEHLRAQKQDVAGIALILFGVLAGLGTYADAAGPVGSFLEAVALGLVGLVGYVVPVLLTWFGLLVVVGRPSPEVGRIAVGLALI